ncbi:MAG TPA: wax ester/triacylglycerol synthase family O-acyltransferase [Acidimicrobiales bacterium]|jgi:WS/DGAT/MGAT family acyltransferase
MRRLNGADVQFIYPERDWRHLHTIKVLVVDATTLPPQGVADLVAAVAAAKLDRLDPLRWLLTRVPANLFHPLWRDLGEIDVRDHIRTVTARSPGDDVELDVIVSRVASSPLRRDRPLWEMVVVDGLEHGRAALVLKLHHSLADGAASLRLIEELCSAEPYDPFTIERPPLTEEPLPGPRRLVIDAAGDAWDLARRMPSMITRLGRATRASAQRKRAGGAQPGLAFSADATVYNRRLTANRSWAHAELSLDTVRAVKERLGGTVNDVFLTLVSLAVGDHLADRGELPAQPMTAAVPATIRDRVADHPWGNFPSNLFIGLASDVDDPVERYQRIAASQRAAKAWHDEREHDLMFDWMQAYPLWTAYTRYLPAIVNRLSHRPSFSLVASNVRGPTDQLYLGALAVVGLHSMGPLVQELGLNLTAWSYRSSLSVGVHTCADHGGDAADIARRFEPALSRLAGRAGARRQ